MVRKTYMLKLIDLVLPELVKVIPFDIFFFSLWCVQVLVLLMLLFFDTLLQWSLRSSEEYQIGK